VSPKVAIVEDVPETQNEFKRYVLNLWPDAEISQFFDAERAIGPLASGQFDVVITDIDLGPGLQAVGGFKVAHALAATNTPLIVVSGASIPDEYRLAFKAMGAWDYLRKPIIEADLRNWLERAIPFREATKHRQGTPGDRDRTADPRLKIDIGGKDTVKWKEKRVALTMTHIRILQKLLERPNEAIKYEEFYQVLKSGTTKTNFRQHIKEMRDAFKEAEPTFDVIRTIHFVGYSWVTE
jgi:DNA-binding response OmpR family regulator